MPGLFFFPITLPTEPNALDAPTDGERRADSSANCECWGTALCWLLPRIWCCHDHQRTEPQNCVNVALALLTTEPALCERARQHLESDAAASVEQNAAAAESTVYFWRSVWQHSGCCRGRILEPWEDCRLMLYTNMYSTKLNPIWTIVLMTTQTLHAGTFNMHPIPSCNNIL